MPKAKTMDGERTRVDQMNTGAQPDGRGGVIGMLKRWNKNLNLLMAGMYTGLNCYGTPKSHHEFEEEDDSGTKPDRRPI